jgi:hypothetical protein
MGGRTPHERALQREDIAGVTCHASPRSSVAAAAESSSTPRELLTQSVIRGRFCVGVQDITTQAW